MIRRVYTFITQYRFSLEYQVYFRQKTAQEPDRSIMFVIFAVSQYSLSYTAQSAHEQTNE